MILELRTRIMQCLHARERLHQVSSAPKEARVRLVAEAPAPANWHQGHGASEGKCRLSADRLLAQSANATILSKAEVKPAS